VTAGRFLTAEWRNLVMLNYELDPSILAPRVPRGCELDTWSGRTFASMVGFQFLRTRVLGVPIPFHVNFDEVNLRFYVRRSGADGVRRGVVFVKEIVPRRAIAWTARALYGENYVALPMSHAIDGGREAETPRTVRYTWRFRGRENALELAAGGEPREADEGSDVQFITEHTWGYARRRDGRTTEYEVEHPRWRIRPATSCRLDCDVAGLYGEPFVEFLSGAPASAFLADGSVVTVYKGDVLAAGSVT
jgi:uncharacterized protein YqjF (DUF2071 family)